MARRRRSRQKKQRNQAILNFVLAGLAIVIIGFAFFALQPAPYDELTLCEISDELPPHTAVIIDKTDEYSEQQAGLIAATIRRTRDRLAIGERLTLFELDQDGQFDPRGEFSLCNPGRGDQVNPLFRNPEQIEVRFNEKFDRPLETILADLVVPKEAPNSPVLEALARLGQTDAFSRRAPQRRIVIISDRPAFYWRWRRGLLLLTVLFRQWWRHYFWVWGFGGYCVMFMDAWRVSISSVTKF